jgi:hypothetical protein
VWGLLLSGDWKTRRGIWAIFAQAMMIYGFGLVFVGPFAVRVSEIHMHAGSLLVIFVALLLYRQWERWWRSNTQLAEDTQTTVVNPAA